MDDEYIKENYNEVVRLTAVCRNKTSWTSDDYSDLEIGKTYHVSHIGVLKSSTIIMLSEMGRKEYNSTCFELYEDGIPLENRYTQDPRFWAPRLRKLYRSSRPGCVEETIMMNSIPNILKEIEKRYDVRILFAVESGSRAWGFASKDSDWDVRFVYVHKPKWYFSVDEQRDVIEELFPNDIDAVGWDLKKALMLLKRSNPSLMEWINSPIVYRAEEHFMDELKTLAQECFNPTKAMYHYQRIYVKHDERYLQKQGYPMKRFMYYLRGILACQWIEKNKTLPPVSFKQLYEHIVEDQKIKDGIKELVNYKSSGKEMDMSEVPTYLVDFYLPLANHYSDIVGQFRPEVNNSGITERLNRFFYETVTNQ